MIPTSTSLLRLASDSEVHGSEDAKLSGLYERVGSSLEEVLYVNSSGGGKVNELHNLKNFVQDSATQPCVLEVGAKVVSGNQRLIPGQVRRQSVVLKVTLFNNLESSALERLQNVLGRRDVGQTVTLLNSFLDGTVLLVRGIVLIGQAPFVASENTSGLENSQDLGVALLFVGCVGGGLDLVQHRMCCLRKAFA